MSVSRGPQRIQRYADEFINAIHHKVKGSCYEENQMFRSILVVELENKESVKQWLQEDLYITGNVWEHIEIVPFRIAEV